MRRGGLWAMIYEKRMPESFHVSTTYCAADYFFYFVTSTKDTAFHTVFKKVSFGQPARQESDKRKLSQHTGKPFHSERLLFSGCIFPAASWNCKKCSLANPYREVFEQSERLFVGTSWRQKLWICGTFGFWFCWIQPMSRLKSKRGLLT